MTKEKEQKEQKEAMNRAKKMEEAKSIKDKIMGNNITIFSFFIFFLIFFVFLLAELRKPLQEQETKLAKDIETLKEDRTRFEEDIKTLKEDRARLEVDLKHLNEERARFVEEQRVARLQFDDGCKAFREEKETYVLERTKSENDLSLRIIEVFEI